MRRAPTAPETRAMREISVTVGAPPNQSGTGTAIQINRRNVESHHPGVVPPVPLAGISQDRSTIYEIPPTPAGTGRNAAPAAAEPVPRLELGGKPSPIYEIPPTPPGIEQRRDGTRCSNIREISVIGDKPRKDDDGHGDENLSGTGRQRKSEASESRPATERQATPERRPAQPNGSTQQKASEKPPLQKTPERRPAPKNKEELAKQKEELAKARAKNAEEALIDFSLFLIRNGSVRSQMRGPRARDFRDSVSASHAAAEGELESLLRKWEISQAEGAAALEGKNAAPFSVLPMFPSLQELPLLNYINSEGKIQPQVDPDTPSSVFAVYDRLKKVQYIGICKNIRNTMRKLMGRRPGFCYYYKLYNYPNVENPQPQSLKQRWIAELGYIPTGNLDPSQRKQWEKPVDVGPCTDRRHALTSAIQKAKKLIQKMVERGLKEEMVYDPALMEFGKCDVLEVTTPAEAPKGKHTVVKTAYGGSIEYCICYDNKTETSTGWTFDVSINKDNEETRHTVTCERENCPENLSEDVFLELVLGFLLHKRIPRDKNHRGFQMNRFSMSEVLRAFDDFKIWLPK